MTKQEKDFILVYGDAFIDYIADDVTNSSFTKYMGGATVNVAAGISRIGAPSALITITGCLCFNGVFRHNVPSNSSCYNTSSSRNG